mmetsp:Transcript_18754/g.30453  ORF Transcript_18754/g.30453 Transcript_18754/m.30453 type:complete len:179 (+) Transcript_18754:505-1041(+)
MSYPPPQSPKADFLETLGKHVRMRNTSALLNLVKCGQQYKGFTILMLVAMHTDGTETLKQILRSFPKELNKRSKSSLEDCLGDLGVAVQNDFHSDKGLSPLMVATMVGPPPSVKALIDAGADLDIKSASGRCVLDLAMIRNDFQIWRCLKDWKPFCSPHTSSNHRLNCHCNPEKCIII